jgi:DNA-binding MarR family transcriptional regulator
METLEKIRMQEGRRQAARLMKRLLNHFRAEMDDKLQPYGVTKAQIQILVAIRDAPASSGAHLARLCEVTPQSVQGLIQKVEESGWIVRGKDSVNDRIITASLTPAGEELLRAVDTVVKQIEDKVWAGIEVKQIEGLGIVLERCLRNFEGD